MIHILLPAYNEGQALGLVLNSIARTLADGDFRVWVVDDGSTDNTAQVAREWARALPLNLLSHEKNLGLGGAWKTGLSTIAPLLNERDVLVTLDADYSHPPECISKMVERVERGNAEMVVASRFQPGSQVVGVSLLRQWTARFASLLFQVYFHVPQVRDYTCGFRACAGGLVKKGMARPNGLVTETGFASTAEWLLRLAAEKPIIREVPFILRYDRKPTPSKMRLLPTITRHLGLLWRLRGIR